MIAAAIASAASPVVASAPRYKLAKSVSLGAPDRWDFVHFDPVQNCVYVAHRTQIDVIDGKTGAIVNCENTGISEAEVVPSEDPKHVKLVLDAFDKQFKLAKEKVGK